MKNNKKILYVIIAVLIIASLTWRWIEHQKLEQTSLLFVGIPAIITLFTVKYSGTPKSAYGVVFKTLTLFLLLCSILFGEGLICIIMMAPIFYGVAALIVYIFEFFKKRNKGNTYSFVIIPLIIIMLGPNSLINEPETQEIQATQIISDKFTIENLNLHPDFLKALPSFFKMGFPTPIKIEGNGLNVGDSRKIHFESNTKGIGILHLQIKEKSETKIVYDIVEDNTHISHWLTWEEVKVEINQLNEGKKQVRWTTRYTCDLGPAWYFEPIENYAVELMNLHLINSFFKQ